MIHYHGIYRISVVYAPQSSICVPNLSKCCIATLFDNEAHIDSNDGLRLTGTLFLLLIILNRLESADIGSRSAQ